MEKALIKQCIHLLCRERKGQVGSELSVAYSKPKGLGLVSLGSKNTLWGPAVLSLVLVLCAGILSWFCSSVLMELLLPQQLCTSVSVLQTQVPDVQVLLWLRGAAAARLLLLQLLLIPSTLLCSRIRYQGS